MANADCIVIQGSNMAECHPVGFQWVTEARARGARVIHVDPRFTRTSAVSVKHLPIRAGSDIVLLGALMPVAAALEATGQPGAGLSVRLHSTIPFARGLGSSAAVGAAIGRTWSDGTGWVSQLAVAKGERGHGLGRALLLESLRRRVAGGAHSLGLSVEVVNRTALALYESVGLRIDREWMSYRH